MAIAPRGPRPGQGLSACRAPQRPGRSGSSGMRSAGRLLVQREICTPLQILHPSKGLLFSRLELVRALLTGGGEVNGLTILCCSP